MSQPSLPAVFNRVLRVLIVLCSQVLCIPLSRASILPVWSIASTTLCPMMRMLAVSFLKCCMAQLHGAGCGRGLVVVRTGSGRAVLAGWSGCCRVVGLGQDCLVGLWLKCSNYGRLKMLWTGVDVYIHWCSNTEPDLSKNPIFKIISISIISMYMYKNNQTLCL